MTQSRRNVAIDDTVSANFARTSDAVYTWGRAISMLTMIPAVRAAWSMSAVGSSGLAVDVTGYGRHLSAGNTPTYNSSSLIPYVSLNGTSQYLSRANEAAMQITGGEGYVASGLRGMTFGAWVNFAGNAASHDTIAGRWLGSTNRSWVFYRFQTTKEIEIIISSDGNALSATATSTATIDDGTWVFLVCRYDPSTSLRVYINGELDGEDSSSVPSSMFAGTASFIIGQNNSTSYMEGDVSMAFYAACAIPLDTLFALYEHTRGFYKTS